MGFDSGFIGLMLPQIKNHVVLDISWT